MQHVDVDDPDGFICYFCGRGLSECFRYGCQHCVSDRQKVIPDGAFYLLPTHLEPT